MKPHANPNHARDEDAFDAIARARHAQAVAGLSARTRLQLDNARRAARMQPTPTSTNALGNRPAFTGWAVGGAFALVTVMAIALQLRHGPTTTAARPTPVATVTADDTMATDPVFVLDENPELYLWLAAVDDAKPSSREY